MKDFKFHSCKMCGKPFKKTRSTHKFCTVTCGHKHWKNENRMENAYNRIGQSKKVLFKGGYMTEQEMIDSKTWRCKKEWRNDLRILTE